MEEGDAPAGGAPAPKKEAAPEPTPAPAAATPAAAAVPTEAPKVCDGVSIFFYRPSFSATVIWL